MGIFQAKVAPLNIPLLIKHLGECHLPEDRNQALDFLEQLHTNLLDKKTIDAQSNILKESEGMRLITKVGKKMVEGRALKLFLDLFLLF
jgi:hypothetical protein